MSDSDIRPRLRRADLRRLRQCLSDGDSPLSEMHPAASTVAAAGTILTVCTGNICRSPMGEVLLRSSLHGLGVRVHSAGTHALVDHEMTEQARQLAVRYGADEDGASAHRARLLTPAEVEESDLVLTMAREHRSHTVQLAPAALHRTFTLREFARLATTLSDDDVRQAVSSAGSDTGKRLRALAQLVAAQRGLVPAVADDDDVIDPYRRSQQTYDLSASQLVPATTETARVVRAAVM